MSALILQQIFIYKHSMSHICIPQIVIARLRNDLGDYIVERGAFGRSVWAWYHRQFWEAARDRYLSNIIDIARSNQSLVDYFTNEFAMKYPDRGITDQPLFWKSEKGDVNFNSMKLTQLPVSLLDTADLVKFKEHICDLIFIAASCAAGFGPALVSTFVKARHLFYDDQLVNHYKHFVTTQMHILQADPEFTLQQALNTGEHSLVYKQAKELETAIPWLTSPPRTILHRKKPQGEDPCVQTFNIREIYNIQQRIQYCTVHSVTAPDGSPKM